MDKNVVLAIVLSILIVIGGVTVQTKFFPTKPEKQDAQTTAQTATSPVNEATKSGEGATDTVVINEPSSGVSASTQVEDLNIAEQRDVIETPLVRVEFSNRGGDIVSFKLKQHSTKSDYVEMAEYVNENNRAFSIILGDANGAPVNQLFNVKKISETEIGFYRPFTVQNADGTTSTFTLVKQYSFKPNDYMFELTVTVDGDASFSGLKMGQSAYTIKTSPQIGPEWNVKQDKYEYRKFYHYANGKKKVTTIGNGQAKNFTDAISWSGVTGKYFALLVLPESPVQGIQYSSVSSNPDNPVSQIFLSRAPITANRNTDTWKIYIGPRTEKFLSKYNIAMNNPYGVADVHLDEVVDSSGILGPLEVLLKKIMELFYLMVPNWGVSIILLTVLTRMILFPLTKKSSEATLKMQELQPRIQEIQEKYRGNPQKMNEEMAKFYKTVGYNPLSGCLPLLIQFPLIFAMYNLFNNYFEFRGAMFIPGWIPDLSTGDSVMTFPFVLPLLKWTDLRLLPIIYVISQLLFGKVTQTPNATQQNASMKIMLYGMPLFFFFIFYNAPAGLLLYWTFSNLLTLVQQVIINRMMHRKKESGLKIVK